MRGEGVAMKKFEEKVRIQNFTEMKSVRICKHVKKCPGHYLRGNI
jgi:hypothetical protein